MSTPEATWATDAIGASRVLRDGLVHRTRELFALMVTARGGSARAASSEIAVDPRSIQDMRTVPSMELVTRVGSGLGLEPHIAVGVVASSPLERTDPAEIRRILAAADLADDSARVAAAAVELALAAAQPCDLALAQLAEARACVGRGELDRAETHARLAREIGISPSDRVLAGGLAEAAAFDATLGSPWIAGSRELCALEWIDEACRGAEQLDEPVCIAQRRAAYRLARSLASGTLAPRAAAALVEDSLAGPPAASAWTASSIALAALSLIARGGHGHEHTRAMTHLFVTAQLALEELASGLDGSTRSTIESRLSRMAFAEWSLRARLDGLTPECIDERDAQEIVRASMRLDGGDPWRHCSPGHLARSLRSTLDASSGDGSMVEQVHFPRASGARMESRSEDPC